MSVMREYARHDYDVVSNPEFLKEGSAIDDFMKPDRVVLGAENERAAKIMAELYGPFVRTGNPVIHMDIESAELTKYAANAMLATRISFMNEVANLCSRLGANIDSVRKGIGSDARIGSRFLFAGIGYGGSCFPKDVKAIIRTAEDVGYDFRVLRAVEAVNETQKLALVDQVVHHFGEDLSGKRFAMWGLAFKPNTDDMREAPSVVIAGSLLERGATLCAYDPEANDECRARYLGDRIDYAERPMEALAGADALLLVTEWIEFRHPNLEDVRSALRTPVIFDGRNIYNRRKMEELGFTYYGIGT
jgi:UDPglucose 6-dehydrogenase